MRWVEAAIAACCAARCLARLTSWSEISLWAFRAAARAPFSYFDQHIIRTDDGCCWVADEGDYETLMQDLVDRIVHTVAAGRSDES